MPRKIIKRGQFVRLPNGGAVAIGRNGELLYKGAPKKKAAPKKKNPARPKRTAPKAKATPRRVLRAMASWVRTQNAAPARKTAKKRTTARKGGRR